MIRATPAALMIPTVFHYGSWLEMDKKGYANNSEKGSIELADTQQSMCQTETSETLQAKTNMGANPWDCLTMVILVGIITLLALWVVLHKIAD